MATGLEALGAASAVLQVISFAGSVIPLCYKIYDGKLMPENGLEEYASQMIHAARRVQTRCQVMPQGTPDEKKLVDVAQKCMDAAKDLQAEALLVTSLCQKGKLSKAIHGAFRASRHKSSILQLEKALQGCKETMEMQLLLKLCTQSDAIKHQQSHGFQGLESDVKALVSQIAQGYTKMEDLIKTEQSTTRDVIKWEAKTTRQEVNTHVASEVQALGARAVSDNQHERLLKSLKPDEMNQRYHDVMDSEDASFELVFLSYERTTRGECNDLSSSEHQDWETSSSDLDSEYDPAKIDEISQTWSCFSSWLQSDSDEIFWIQGKPGSGKSTLMKFVVDNDNTKQLLHSWSPCTKLLSHFFWKIGSAPQNSIKGLLCSLLHSLLSGRSDTIDRVLSRFGGSSSKDSYHDWSVRELEAVLLSIMEKDAGPACIFIDGLDEISDKDGCSRLMDLVEKLNACKKVKVCVSSRPETQLVQRLEAAGALSLRLEDLTRPEMRAHVNKELERFQTRGHITSTLQNELTEMLLRKAEGVFLWLFLATNSLINGIQNDDDEATLLQRLEALPGELELLYAEMWERLNANNSVYRETAGRYFRYVIASRPGVVVIPKRSDYKFWADFTLAEVALAEGVDVRKLLPPGANDISLADLKSICETTADNIRKRCAGLLQLGPGLLHISIGEVEYPGEVKFLTQKPGFIHRTVHDFLVETEAGQRILNYKHDPSLSTDTNVKLVKCTICPAITLHREFGLRVRASELINHLARWMRHGGDQKAITGMLPIIQGLYEEGIFGNNRRLGFLALLVSESPYFDDFIISSLEQTSPLSATANEVLFKAVAKQRGMKTMGLIQRITSLGADPHAIGPTRFTHLHWDLSSLQQYTTFELFLGDSLSRLVYGSPHDVSARVDIIDMMARTCQTWHKKMLFTGRIREDGSDIPVIASKLSDLPSCYHLADGDVGIVYEVDLQFLLARFLAAADLAQVLTGSSRLHELANTFTDPFVRIRYVYHHNEDGSFGWHRVLDQKPFHVLISALLNPGHDKHLSLKDLHARLDGKRNTEIIEEKTALVDLAQEAQEFLKLEDFDKPPTYGTRRHKRLGQGVQTQRYTEDTESEQELALSTT
ncbi:hypothetical protein ACJZ2D_013101 [Fusarium nematophilum]